MFPSLEFGWIWQDGEPPGVDGPLAGLAWTVPIFDRNQAEKTRAAAGLRAARADLEIEERKARADLTAAQEAYAAIRGSAVDAWDVTADLDPLIEAALASFQAGERTDTDLLDILASALEARLSALELYSAALSAHRALEEAAGKPLTAGASR
jgi:outer membrane protein TolC